MNPRIARDIRLIQLPLIAGMVLMIGGVVISPALSIVAWMAASAIVVASVYVGDMTPNGLALAMTLPVPRSLLWREKTRVAAIALFAMSSAYLCLYATLSYIGRFQVVTPLIDVLFVVSLPLFFLGAGAAISILVRQAIATFWLLLLATGALFIFSSVAVPWIFPKLNIFYVLCALFLIGGAAGLWIAAGLFVRFEDTGDGDTLGHIELGSFLGGKKDRKTKTTRASHIAAIVVKELVLQQINVVLTLGIVMVIGVVALTLPLGFLMKVVWLPKLIALLIAFVVGAVAFAEEERIGIATWALTYPARRRTQFVVKLAVAIFLAMTLSLGGVVAMDALMNVRAISNQFTPIYQLVSSHFVLLGILAPLGACLAGGFASSFSRSFLSALSHTLLTGMVLYGLYLGFGSFLVRSVPIDYRTAPDALLLITAAPVLLLVFAWGSWKNFVRESTRSKAVSSYLRLAVALGCVMVLNTLVFQRAWEWPEPDPRSPRFAIAPTDNFPRSKPIITTDGSYAILRDGSLWRTHHNEIYRVDVPFEHQPYRITGAAEWVEVIGRSDGMFARTADGSLWMQGSFFVRSVRFKPLGADQDWVRDVFWDRIELFNPRRVAPGTRWKSLQGGHWSGETVAIRDDGTLWMWGQPSTNVFRVDLDGPVQMTQLSPDTDWKQVVGRVALKEDGSLWVLDGRTFSILGVGKDTLEWGPTRAPINETFSELIPVGARYWGAAIGKTTDGRALFLGWVHSLNEWQAGSPDASGVSVEPLNPANNTSWFKYPDFVLTSDDQVLARKPKVDIGTAWVALGFYGGYTRDGSYWHLRRQEWHGKEGLHRVAQWLHLSLHNGEVRRIIPPRWRPEMVGKLYDSAGD